MHLRNMNAYVASALSDWAEARRTAAHIPLQAAPYPASGPEEAAAGAVQPPLCNPLPTTALHHVGSGTRQAVPVPGIVDG